MLFYHTQMAMRWTFVLVALAGSSLYAAETKWIKLKSPNFEMYTTASEGNGRETLKYFEQVRDFFVQTMGSIPGRSAPVRIIAFSSRKEYEPYRPNSVAIAFYHSTPTTEDIVLSQVGVEVVPVAIHEYVHLVTRRSGLKLPPWLNEGLAELYSTLRPMGEKIVVGNLIQGRYQALLREKWVPLSEIVAADRNSPYLNEKSQAGSLYNEGWALTHMMMLTHDYRAGFPQFAGLVSGGMPTEDALRKIYGKSVEQVDKELQAYLRGGHFQGVIFPQKLEKVTAEIPAQPASAFDVELALADLLNRPGKEQETQTAMEQLAAEDPKRPEPFAAMGYLALRRHANDEAVKNFEKAFSLGDRDPALLWDYGRMLRNRNRPESIRILSELVAQDPMRVDSRLELAAVQLNAKEHFAALATLNPVKKVSKEEAVKLFSIKARAQLAGGLLTEARQSAQNLAKFALTDDDKFQAEQILKSVDARLAGGNAPPEASTPEAARPALRRATEHKMVSGWLSRLDCSGKPPKVLLETAEGNKVFLIDDPDEIIGTAIELTCGVQTKVMVRIEYVPANQAGIDGLVRGIQFEP